MKHIRSISNLQQPHDFSGLQWETERGLLRPTDMDFWMEFNDEAFIFGEIKRKGTSLTTGQRLALYRISRRLMNSGAKVLTVILEWTDATYPDVSRYRVRERFYMVKGEPQWQELSKHQDAGQYIKHWLHRFDILGTKRTPGD